MMRATHSIIVVMVEGVAATAGVLALTVSEIASWVAGRTDAVKPMRNALVDAAIDVAWPLRVPMTYSFGNAVAVEPRGRGLSHCDAQKDLPPSRPIYMTRLRILRLLVPPISLSTSNNPTCTRLV
jgi:hypothetical protein